MMSVSSSYHLALCISITTTGNNFKMLCNNFLNLDGNCQIDLYHSGNVKKVTMKQVLFSRASFHITSIGQYSQKVIISLMVFPYTLLFFLYHLDAQTESFYHYQSTKYHLSIWTTVVEIQILIVSNETVKAITRFSNLRRQSFSKNFVEESVEITKFAAASAWVFCRE